METVKITHPGTGLIAEVPESSLRYHYGAGWVPLAEDEAPSPGEAPEPAPMTRAEAARASKAGSKAANAGEDKKQ